MVLWNSFILLYSLNVVSFNMKLAQPFTYFNQSGLIWCSPTVSVLNFLMAKIQQYLLFKIVMHILRNQKWYQITGENLKLKSVINSVSIKYVFVIYCKNIIKHVVANVKQIQQGKQNRLNCNQAILTESVLYTSSIWRK